MRTRVFLVFATVLVLESESVYSQCHLCGTQDAAIQNPDANIPLLKIPGPIPTTCRAAENYARIIEASDPMCEQLQLQSVHCQCSNAVVVAPYDACNLCNDGSSPPFSDRSTPYGSTCQELNQYLQTLTKDQCQNPNNYPFIEDIKSTAFGCGCLHETASCPMCQSDESINIAYPDRAIPFLSFIDVGGSTGLLFERSNPTCQDLAILASSEDPSNSLCQVARDNAGFCGCPGIQPENKCTFCPDGKPPAREDYMLPTLDTCGELNAYMSFMNEQECQSERAREMRALDYLCGCKDSEPQCTLCPDGSHDFDPDLQPEPHGPTCLELALSISALPRDVCEEQRSSIIGISAFRCGCPSAKVPVCATRDNSHLCTQELLDKALQSQSMTDEEKKTCECFAFCDGEFVKCHEYPGGVLPGQVCPGVAVSGCNSAIAIPTKIDGSKNATSVSRGHYNTTGLAVIVALVVSILC